MEAGSSENAQAAVCIPYLQIIEREAIKIDA